MDNALQELLWAPIVHKDYNTTDQHKIDISSETENEKTSKEYTNEQWNEVLNPESSLSPNTRVPDNKPPPLPCGRVSSTQPKVVTYSRDVFQKSIGFCNVNKVLAKMNQVAQPTLKINDISRDPMQDLSKMATMPKKLRNTTPLQRLEQFEDVFHFDIVYGSRTAIGGYRYALWLLNRCSKRIEQYPLKSLASNELLVSLRLFCRDMGGRYPDKIIGNRNFKLVGVQVAAVLEGINEDRK